MNPHSQPPSVSLRGCAARPRRRAALGFTLVEVTLSIALTSTVAVALLALLPVGIDSMRQSALTSAHARILQSVAGHCQMVDWNLLTSTSYQSKVHAFDYQGGELLGTQGDDVTFLARSEVSNARPLPGTSSSNSRMRTVVVRIINGSDAADFGTSAEFRYVTHIAQMDDTP